MRFAETALPLLPTVVHEPLARVLAYIFYMVKVKERKIVRKNLGHIFYDKPVDSWYTKKLVWQTYCNFGRVFLDFLKIPMMTREDFLEIFEDRATANLRKALAQKQGAILISMHLGNWDLAGVVLGVMNFPVVAVAEPTEGRFFKFYKKRRERTGIETVLTDEGIKLVKALRQNKVVVLIADRDITGSGEEVKFFDGKRKVPLGPIRLAQRLKVPVLLGCFALNDNSKRYVGYIEPFFFFPSEEGEAMKTMVSFFEKTIKKYPDQWFVFEDEWID